MNANNGTFENSQTGTERGQTKGTDRAQRAAKDHQDYWKPRLRKRNFTDRNGKTVEIPEWQVRLKHQRKTPTGIVRREAWFNLGTTNKSVAAVTAREIYKTLSAAGWDAVMAKFKPSPLAKADVCTVGEFLADVAARSHLKTVTVRRYAVKLRKIVADLAKVESGMAAKDKLAKYDYVNGGRKAWMAKVDGQSLEILTPEVISEWRNRYVAKSGKDPVSRKSAERSAASYLRCARALFTPDVVGMLQVKLPPNPFAGVKLKDPGAQRYHSEVNPEFLLGCAARELREKRPQEFLALFLCLWAGLRRKEADLLTWEQVDFKEGRLHIRRTAYFEPKTEESQRMIDLAPAALDVLRSFKAGGKSVFVLDGAQPKLSATYDYYRCDHTWRALTVWLRSKGVSQRKAIHSLRKESGSLIASNFGIEAARQHLGHRDIRTTSSHYVDKKKRVEISLPMGGDLGKLHVLANGE